MEIKRLKGTFIYFWSYPNKAQVPVQTSIKNGPIFVAFRASFIIHILKPPFSLSTQSSLHCLPASYPNPTY